MIALSMVDRALKINEEHARCIGFAKDSVESARDAVRSAIEVGRHLSEAKPECGQGDWIPWVEVNCNFNKRQAQKYMRAFKNRDLIEDQMRSQTSHLTALEIIELHSPRAREQGRNQSHRPTTRS